MACNMYYVLDESKNPVPVRGIMDWSARFANHHEWNVGRSIGYTNIKGKRTPVLVSTVFTGICLEPPDVGLPRMFETKAFALFNDELGKVLDTDSATSWSAAENNHWHMIEKLELAGVEHENVPRSKE